MDTEDPLRTAYDEAEIPEEVEQHFTEVLQRQAHPVIWHRLPPEVAEDYWRELDRWVTWLRTTFALPPAVLPPMWHRHSELVWELAALHGRFHDCYKPSADPSGPIAWMQDFAHSRERLREWVAISGTRMDRDRPTRQTIWPGEHPQPVSKETTVINRADDFEAFVVADVAARIADGDDR